MAEDCTFPFPADILGSVASFPDIKPAIPEPAHGQRQRYRTIWISDVHFGTRGCNANLLIDFLDHTVPRSYRQRHDVSGRRYHRWLAAAEKGLLAARTQ